MNKALILLIFLLIPIVLADKVVTNSIGIESDKHIYYCQPIFNQKGECLITAQIKIENNKTTADYKIKATYTTTVLDTSYYLKEKYDSKTGIVSVKDKTKLKTEDDKSTIINIKKDEVIILDVQFFTLANGKFNISVSDGVITTTLDPFYNITVSPISPSYWLRNGWGLESNMQNYTNLTDITIGLSDNNPSTTYETSFGQPFYYSDMVFYYPMNCLALSGSCDNSPYNNPLYVLPNAFFVNSTDPYLYKRLQVQALTSSGATANWQSQMLIGVQDFSFCARVTQTASGAGRYVFSNFDTGGSGYGIYFDNSNRPHCVIKDDNSAEVDLSLVTAIALNNPANVCCVRNITAQTVRGYINSTLSATSSATLDTSVTTYGDLKIGTRAGFGASNFVGFIDEVVLWKRALVPDDLSFLPINGANFRDRSQAIQPYFNHTFEANKTYYLHIKTSSIFPLRVSAMDNSTHANFTKIYESQIYGETYVPLATIATTGYNNPFRVQNMYPKNITISEINLIESLNDTTAPTIYGCAVNDSNLDCDDGMNWYCHVSDDGLIQNVTFTIEFNNMINITRPAVQDTNDTSLWEVKLTSFETFVLLYSYGWAFNSTAPMKLAQVTAQDLGSNVATNTTDLKVNNTYSCILFVPCTENWLVNYTTCSFNDTQIKFYTDANACGTNSSLPSDNGTIISCNYCSQDLTKIYNNSCFLNGTDELINYYYQDDNFYSCCAITGLLSDCSILYEPYNGSYYEPCVLQSNEFEVEYDDTCQFGLEQNDKCYWKIHLNGTTSEFNCLTYVRTSLDKLIQTNPSYTAKSNTLITLKGTEYEDRTSFTTQKGLANVYFTKENLVIDGRTYIFSVECSNGTQTYKVDRTITPEYQNINSPITRLPFIANNATAIVAIIIGVVIVLILIFWAWRLSK